MIGEYILELHTSNATNESIKSYGYDEYQPITRTQLNSGWTDNNNYRELISVPTSTQQLLAD